MRKKYLVSVNRFNHEVTDYVERIGRLFILKNLVPFQTQILENEELEAEKLKLREEIALAQS